MLHAASSALIKCIYKTASIFSSAFLLSLSILQVSSFGQQQQSFGPEGTIVTEIAPDTKGSIYCGGLKAFRSTDAGNSWNNIKGETGVECMAADMNGNVYIGSGLLFKSSDYGASWDTLNLPLWGFFDHQAITTDSKGSVYTATPLCIFRSDDQGSTFKSIFEFSGRNNTYDIYTGGNGEIFASTEWGIFRSWDNGKTWTYPEWGMQNVYSIRKNSKGTIFIAGNRGLYRSDDNCRSWNKLYDCPDIKSLTIAGDGTLYISTSESGVKKSSNEGLSWLPVNNGMPVYNIHTVLADDGGAVYAATDAGIYKSTDKGQSWNPQNKGLGYAMAVDFKIAPNGNYFTAAFGVIYRSTDKGSSWKAINDTNNISYIRMIAVSPEGNIFIGGKKLLRSSDNGEHWEKMNGLPDDGYNAIAFLPNGHIIAARYSMLFISEDNGNSWRELYNNSYGSSGHITSVAYDKYSGKLYVLFAGKIMYSSDEGQSWKDVYPGIYNAGDLLINGTGHLFITDYTSGIYRSIDGGSSWKKLAGTFSAHPDQQFSQAAVNSNGHLYTSTTRGAIFRSMDNGRSWVKTDNGYGEKLNLNGRNGISGLSQLIIDEEGFLYAVTPYDGIFRSQMSTSPEKIPNIFVQEELALGRQRISRNHDTTLAIYNIGGAALSITSVTSADTLFRAHPAELIIPPYNQSEDTISYFLPAIGLKESLLLIKSNSSTGPDTVRISAFGYGVPKVRFLPERLDFDTVGIAFSKDMELIISNEGDDTLKIYNKAASAPYYSIRAYSLIAPGMSICDTIRFTPWEPVLSKGKMVLYSNTGARLDTAYFSGIGRRVPVLSIFTKKVNLGDVSVISTRQFGIDMANAGSDTLKVSKIVSASKLFRIEKDSFTVRPGYWYTVKMSYTPVIAGRDSSVFLVYNNSNTKVDTFTVVANAVNISGEKEENIGVYEYSLFPNYPNPFNPRTQIGFSLAERGMVTLRVYNSMGQIISELVNGSLSAGMHNVEFDAGGLSSGIYIYKLEVSGKYTAMKKMLLLK